MLDPLERLRLDQTRAKIVMTKSRAGRFGGTVGAVQAVFAAAKDKQADVTDQLCKAVARTRALIC